jgi:hypothetical protein
MATTRRCISSYRYRTQGSDRRRRQADERLGRLQTARDRLGESILEAQAHQTRYAGGKEMVFEVGDKVWLSAKHIQTARPSKKLHYKRLGPFKMTKVINRNAYRLELRRRRMGGRTHPRFTQAVPEAVVSGAMGRLQLRPYELGTGRESGEHRGTAGKVSLGKSR